MFDILFYLWEQTICVGIGKLCNKRVKKHLLSE